MLRNVYEAQTPIQLSLIWNRRANIEKSSMRVCVWVSGHLTCCFVEDVVNFTAKVGQR